jgi:hypothetical protein
MAVPLGAKLIVIGLSDGSASVAVMDVVLPSNKRILSTKRVISGTMVFNLLPEIKRFTNLVFLLGLALGINNSNRFFTDCKSIGDFFDCPYDVSKLKKLNKIQKIKFKCKPEIRMAQFDLAITWHIKFVIENMFIKFRTE